MLLIYMAILYIVLVLGVMGQLSLVFNTVKIWFSLVVQQDYI